MIDKTILISPVPGNRKVDAVYFDVEKNKLYREPILHFVITESEEKGMQGVQCYEPLVIDLENDIKSILDYVEFVGLEFDGHQKVWEREIIETKECYNNQKEK